MNGALLIHKPAGITSFGVIEALQKEFSRAQGLKKRKELPKMGHGGTLDPFAEGLLLLCVGRGVKLARYFLGSDKVYEGTIRFGQTTIPGDPTAPISETSEVIPESLERIQEVARGLTLQPYLQLPPMHSAKKHEGRPLYELARQGIEIEREPVSCQLFSFDILDYEVPCARFRVACSSGTYIRTLAQDLARLLGTVALLDSLKRTASGGFRLENALPLDAVLRATAEKQLWDELSGWIPFDRMLEGYARTEATQDEVTSLMQGRQRDLLNLVRRAEPPTSLLYSGPYSDADNCLAVYSRNALVAVLRKPEGAPWEIERVFT